MYKLGEQQGPAVSREPHPVSANNLHQKIMSLTGKDPDAGRDWGQEEKGMTEDEMAGWHHRLDGREFGQTLGDGEGQGSLACCSPWGRGVTRSHTHLATEQQLRRLRVTEPLCCS